MQGDAGGRGCGGAPTGLMLNSSLPRRAAGSQGSRSPRSSWLLSAPGAAGCRPRPWRKGRVTSAVRGAGGHVHKRRRWGSHSRPQGALRTAGWLCRPSVRHASKTGWRPPAARLSPGSQPGQHGLIFPGRCGPRPGTPTLLPHIQGSAQGPGVTCDFSKHLLAGEVAGLPGPQPVLPPPPQSPRETWVWTWPSRGRGS